MPNPGTLAPGVILDAARATLRDLQAERRRCRPSRRGQLDKELAETADMIAAAEIAALEAATEAEQPPVNVYEFARVGLDPHVALCSDVVVPFDPARRRARRVRRNPGGAR